MYTQFTNVAAGRLKQPGASHLEIFDLEPP